MIKNTKPMGSEESGDEYEVSESEPEQSFKTTQKKVQPPQASSSEEDSESESEPESDQAPTTTQKKVSEASSSEEDSESTTQKKFSEASSSAPTTTQKKVSSSESDQPAPTTQEKVQPKASEQSLKKPTTQKKVSESSSSDELKVEKTVTKAVEKKLLFQRFWSESDEIAILNGMIDYPNKTKLDHVANMSAFHDFIKDKFHQEVTRTQLRDKIWKLRKKYEKNTSKTKDMVGRKAHDQKVYELSKLVWGKDEGVGSVRKASCKRSACDIALDVGENRMEKMKMKIGSDLFEMGSGIEGEREWKRLKVEELELSIKQMEVKVAQSKLVLGVFKSNNI